MNRRKMTVEDNVVITLYYKSGYINALKKIDEIEKNADREYVISNAKFLLSELKENYQSLAKKKSFLNDFKGNITAEYEFTDEVLNSIINDGIEFDGNSIRYTNYDTWKEYYVKYNSSIFFEDWFISYNPIRWKIRKRLFCRDYFSDPLQNEYAYNPGISTDYLISKYYYQISSLEMDINLKDRTQIENYLINNKKSKEILIFWCFDE